jgi:hypothetical protein
VLNSTIDAGRNGDGSLTIEPGRKLDREGKLYCFGCPYGTIPRLLLTSLATEAVRTQRGVYKSMIMPSIMVRARKTSPYQQSHFSRHTTTPHGNRSCAVWSPPG